MDSMDILESYGNSCMELDVVESYGGQINPELPPNHTIEAFL